jgi:hypothetical protein
MALKKDEASSSTTDVFSNGSMAKDADDTNDDGDDDDDNDPWNASHDNDGDDDIDRDSLKKSLDVDSNDAPSSSSRWSTDTTDCDGRDHTSDSDEREDDLMACDSSSCRDTEAAPLIDRRSTESGGGSAPLAMSTFPSSSTATFDRTIVTYMSRNTQVNNDSDGACWSKDVNETKGGWWENDGAIRSLLPNLPNPHSSHGNA